MAIHYGDQKWDLRTLKGNLRQGKTTQKEYEAYLKGLPNEATKVREIDVFEEEKSKLTFAPAGKS